VYALGGMGKCLHSAILNLQREKVFDAPENEKRSTVVKFDGTISQYVDRFLSFPRTLVYVSGGIYDG
jgi:hypothetical protein